MRCKIVKSNFFWPSALLGAATIALLLTVDISIVGRLDREARDREQAVVANGMDQRRLEVSQAVLPMVIWDEAVRNLDNHFSPAWAQRNLATYLSTVDHIDAAFVLDADDALKFSSRHGQPAQAESFAPFAPHAETLLSQVRAAERRRGALTKTAPQGGIMASPIQASTFAQVAGDLYILTATLVQPDFGAARPKGPRAPIVLTGKKVDDAFLAQFSGRYLLRDLHLHAGDAREEAQEAHAPLFDDRGADIATVDWTPERPGAALLKSIGPSTLVMIAALGALALLLYSRMRRVAQGLITSEARAAHLAYHDALTGIPNRVLFADRLSGALQRARRTSGSIAVLCVDLDRFKDVNDTYGHHAGDELIRQASQRMARTCRTVDTLARLSGDEFAIVQEGASPADAAALANRLIETMSAPFDLSVGRVFVGCSIGITLVDDPDLAPPEALRQADLALYRSKQSRRGQYSFFEIEMDHAIKTRRALEADLRQALADDALEMVYQPQVNGRGVMNGVEALVRWRHPERGYVSPAFFVPIAEECGLIIDLGLFTLRRAFADSHRWPGLKVAVNVSANQLRTRDFVGRLRSLVEETGADPRRFELEITEGLLLGDDPETHETLKQIRAMGFSLALDDFGTGYSSLSYLQKYPITKIKIDRSFIANLGVDEEADAVVGAIVKLARALRLGVIAEGVETAEQRQRLAAAGCSEVQGFLFSRPTSAEDIDTLRRQPAAPLTELAA